MFIKDHLVNQEKDGSEYFSLSPLCPQVIDYYFLSEISRKSLEIVYVNVYPLNNAFLQQSDLLSPWISTPLLQTKQVLLLIQYFQFY